MYATQVEYPNGQKSVVKTGGGQIHPVVETRIFDLDSQVWRDGPDLPSGVSGGASVQFGDTFLIVSGIYDWDIYGYKYSRSIYKFVSDPEGWIKLPQTLSVGFYHFDAFLVSIDFIDCN